MINEAAHASAAPPDPSAELHARQMADLRALAEAAAGFVNDLRDKAASGQASPPRETSEAFERYARCLRLTIAMERRLQAEEAERLAPAPLDPQAEGALAILAARSAVAAKPPTRADRRRDVVTNVTWAMIDNHAEAHPEFDKAEALEEFERMVEKDVTDEEALNRPILEIIALVCRELGVEPDWNLWQPADWTRPDWGLTQAELSEDAHPLGPYEPCSVRWPPPGTVMPLPGTKPEPPNPSPP